MGSSSRDGFLSWLHFGDLHVTGDDQDNYRDFEKLADAANEVFQDRVDFALLPGDNADNGTPEQYRLVKRIADKLKMPLEIIPGDHDFEPGSLTNYFDVLGAKPLPRGLTISGYRCLFLDMVSAGTGGPDFKLGAAQQTWLERELADADNKDQQTLLFMHTYPADLGHEASGVYALLRNHDVAVVDMGHTHYNEIANDGRIIYMATRSTGQIEEGPVGFSVSAIDDGHVSWRFRELSHDRPFVLITSPADRRLTRDATDDTDSDRSRLTVNAAVWGADDIAHVECRLGEGVWTEMNRVQTYNRWTLDVDTPQGAFAIEVRARDTKGTADSMSIEVAAPGGEATKRYANGSDADHVGAWTEIGLCGTQLGPNRNGRKW